MVSTLYAPKLKSSLKSHHNNYLRFITSQYVLKLNQTDIAANNTQIGTASQLLNHIPNRVTLPVQTILLELNHVLNSTFQTADRHANVSSLM